MRLISFTVPDAVQDFRGLVRFAKEKRVECALRQEMVDALYMGKPLFEKIEKGLIEEFGGSLSGGKEFEDVKLLGFRLRVTIPVQRRINA